jgi:hypothetical protein
VSCPPTVPGLGMVVPHPDVGDAEGGTGKGLGDPGMGNLPTEYWSLPPLIFRGRWSHRWTRHTNRGGGCTLMNAQLTRGLLVTSSEGA